MLLPAAAPMIDSELPSSSIFWTKGGSRPAGASRMKHTQTKTLPNPPPALLETYLLQAGASPEMRIVVPTRGATPPGDCWPMRQAPLVLTRCDVHHVGLLADDFLPQSILCSLHILHERFALHAFLDLFHLGMWVNVALQRYLPGVCNGKTLTLEGHRLENRKLMLSTASCNGCGYSWKNTDFFR